MSKTIVYTVSIEETYSIAMDDGKNEVVRLAMPARKVFTDFDDAVEYVEKVADSDGLRTSDNHRLSDRAPYDMGWRPSTGKGAEFSAVATLFPVDGSRDDGLLCATYHIAGAELV